MSPQLAPFQPGCRDVEVHVESEDPLRLHLGTETHQATIDPKLSAGEHTHHHLACLFEATEIRLVGFTGKLTNNPFKGNL